MSDVEIEVSDRGAIPENEETRKIFALIGKPLTLVEIRAGGVLYLEFDPHGSMTFQVHVGITLATSIVKKAGHKHARPPEGVKPKES